MPQYTIQITDEQEKALLWNIVDLQDWLETSLYGKAERLADKICRLALEDQTNTILTAAEKQTLRSYLTTQGIIFTSIEKLPLYVKSQIVAHANITLAKDKEPIEP